MKLSWYTVMYQRANTTFDSVCHNDFYLVLVMYQQGWTQRSSLYVTTTFARYRVMYQRRADTTFTSVCHNGFYLVHGYVSARVDTTFIFVRHNDIC